MSSCITATPVTGSANEGLTKTNLLGRDLLPPVVLQDILNLASNLFAVQLVGSKSHQDQLNHLCFNFDPTRLHYQGYNITILHEIFCEAGWATFIGGNDSYVPDTPLIQALTTTFSTYIWIFQAVSAMNNDPYRLKQLCGLIILEPSFNVGLNATLVQDSICGAGEGKVLPKVLELPVPFEDLRKSRLGNGTKGVETFVEAAGRG